jgi:hypothetical protein
MAVTVVLFDDAGAALPEGLGVELLRGAEVVAEARVDGQGTVSFETEAEGTLAVRLKASGEVVKTAA